VDRPRLVFAVAIAADVGNGDSLLEHHLGDEQATVALDGILLAAHDRHTAALDAACKALDAAAERLTGGNLPVQDVSVLVVELGTLRATAELLAQKQILPARLLDDIREVRTIGPLDESGVRPRPHIDQNLNPKVGEKRSEVLRGVIRMPNGEQRPARTRHR
jgi:hypothetical protein